MNVHEKTAGYRYCSFKQLENQQALNKDYRISICDVGSDITVIAPHGGKIEPRTSTVGRLVAGENYNCYCFEGIKEINNCCLHLTSHQFDEPHAVDILSRSSVVVAVHACKDRESIVYLGGLDRVLKHLIAWELRARTIETAMDHPVFRGVNPDNICNRGATGRGVQLELSRGLRDNEIKTQKTAEGVRTALGLYRDLRRRLT